MIASATVVATVSMTVSVQVRYIEARCPKCGRLVAAIPGPAELDIRVRQTDADRSGRGIVVACGRCKARVEVMKDG